MKKYQILIFAIIVVFILLSGYFFLIQKKTEDKDEIPAAVKKLYEDYTKYNVGFSIDECSYDNKKVYNVGINAPDAGSNFFNSEGIQIGECNYFANQVDEICKNAQNCETIYMPENNIWGQLAADKYNLEGK